MSCSIRRKAQVPSELWVVGIHLPPLVTDTSGGKVQGEVGAGSVLTCPDRPQPKKLSAEGAALLASRPQESWDRWALWVECLCDTPRVGQPHGFW